MIIDFSDRPNPLQNVYEVSLKENRTPQLTLKHKKDRLPIYFKAIEQV